MDITLCSIDDLFIGSGLWMQPPRSTKTKPPPHTVGVGPLTVEVVPDTYIDEPFFISHALDDIYGKRCLGAVSVLCYAPDGTQISSVRIAIPRTVRGGVLLPRYSLEHGGMGATWVFLANDVVVFKSRLAEAATDIQRMAALHVQEHQNQDTDSKDTE
jgi:hypothetical protein